MKPTIKHFFRRWFGVCAVSIAALLLLSACGIEQKLFWSPDGQRAIILTSDGFSLCDAQGSLSPLLIPNVERVAWLPNSKQALVSIRKYSADWANISSVISKEDAKKIAAKAESLMGELEGGKAWKEITKSNGEWELIYMRTHLQQRLKQRLTEKQWADLGKKTASWFEVALAEVRKDSASIVQVYGDLIMPPAELRISPDGQAAAITTTQQGVITTKQLLLVQMEKPGFVILAQESSLYPDWTSDGRSLVYDQAVIDDQSSSNQAGVGMLVMRKVRNAQGAIEIEEQGKELAGLIHDGNTRVRCLKDGRIIFNAFAMSLPASSADMKEVAQRLYLLDPQRHSALVPLMSASSELHASASLDLFEISPDERKILLAGRKESAICVLTITSGEIEAIQDTKQEKSSVLPCWRAPDEICYLRMNPSVEGKPAERRFEVVLRKGEKETVLSTDWSREFLDKLSPKTNGN